MKTNIIHYYKHKNAFLKTSCGIEWDDIKEHTGIKEYVTCKKCLKKMNNEL